MVIIDVKYKKKISHNFQIFFYHNTLSSLNLKSK